MRVVYYETAERLAALGYDGEATRWYGRDGNLKSSHLVDDDIAAPRLDDAAYWLLERYNIHTAITYGYDKVHKRAMWQSKVRDLGRDMLVFTSPCQEQLEDALYLGVVFAIIHALKYKTND